ncbi:MAG: 50S ribosomal protein L6 [Nitrospinae bacterium]|nr:50S ribosomal protein L6 [Nitrospinota bacterium]
MSRIGKMPIKLLPGVTASLKDRTLEVKGKLGNLYRNISTGISVEIGKEEILVTRASDSRTDKSLHGLTRTLIQNMVVGVGEGFKKVLQINGVGYRASVAGKALQLTLGFSHEVKYPAPEGITFSVQGNEISVFGRDKEMVGQVAAEIRSFRPPEPYKGKGIFYFGEKIIRKAGKTGAKK